VRVSSLESLAYQAKLKEGIVCSFFDARRENVYAGIYRVSNDQVTTIKPDANVAFSDLTKNLLSFNEEITLLSPDIKKFEELMKEDLKKQTVIPDLLLHIINRNNLALICYNKFKENQNKITPEYLIITESAEK